MASSSIKGWDGGKKQSPIMETSVNYPPDELYPHGLQRERFLPATELLKDNLKQVQPIAAMTIACCKWRGADFSANPDCPLRQRAHGAAVSRE
ncbi:MAG: hypothetical protein PHT15_00075 [Gallionellaceae bacterium]|nr:hypothetical protein [Gallionellaceae bacterium]